MNYINRALTPAIIIASVLSTQSCSKCGGVDVTYHTYSASITPGETIVKLSEYQQHDNTLYINPVTTTEEGDRDCHNKDMVINFGETLDGSSIIVYANRDMRYSNSVTVPAGTNLLKEKNVFDIMMNVEGDYSKSEIKLDKLNMSDLEPGEYVFTIEGKTKQNQTPYKNSTTITYQ